MPVVADTTGSGVGVGNVIGTCDCAWRPNLLAIIVQPLINMLVNVAAWWWLLVGVVVEIHEKARVVLIDMLEELLALN